MHLRDKAQNAWDAGAVGVILYMADASPLVSPSGLTSIGIPVVMISLADGQSLVDYAASVWPPLADINPHGIEMEATPNLVVGFSSIGPSADAGLKPDLVAVGGNWNNIGSMYMAAQKYDPLGDLYSADGYANADGTSFSTPLVSGAAALVKQKHPGFTAAQVKSALVNTASNAVTHDDSGDSVDVRWLGGGLLAADAAVAATVTSDPATISFGSLRPGRRCRSTRTIHHQELGHGERESFLGGDAGGGQRRGIDYGDSAQRHFGAGSFGDRRGDSFRIGSRRGSVFGRDYGAGRPNSLHIPVSFLRSERSRGQSDSAERRFLSTGSSGAGAPRARSRSSWWMPPACPFPEFGSPGARDPAGQ